MKTNKRNKRNVSPLRPDYSIVVKYYRYVEVGKKSDRNFKPLHLMNGCEVRA